MGKKYCLRVVSEGGICCAIEQKRKAYCMPAIRMDREDLAEDMDVRTVSGYL